MHSPSLKTAVRRIRSLAEPPDAPPDADLLARFRATRDDRAFAALVARHGPAVLGVCRRVLADPHAAEDAFQATFLVLARKAASDHPHIGIVVASGHHTPAPGDLPDTACFIKKPFSAGVVHDHLRRILPDDRKPEPLKSGSRPLRGL